MGVLYSTTYRTGTAPDYIPPKDVKPTFDPNYGFKDPRKERVPLITEQEMKALKIPRDRRDYCAHILRDYLTCKHRYSWYVMCQPEYHAYQHCEIEEYQNRMKEYEREKRLRIRQLKKEGKTVS